MKGARGFSLIGVLVSLLVLAFGVLALLRLQSTLLLDEQDAGDYAYATNLAQSALEEGKACAPVLCANADFAPAHPETSVPVTAYTCRTTQGADTTTVAVRWHNAEGVERTLEVASPRTDCTAQPPEASIPGGEVPVPDTCLTMLTVSGDKHALSAKVTAGRCSKTGADNRESRWRCESRAAKGSLIEWTVFGKQSHKDTHGSATASCKG
ncbi:type IV pilus modification PilV family protein [Crenobacter caeni]|uniref:Uncharacterized protein n=1 Tax=Crenobacter caeni TaxID=2705474 RepID=A0A6B2KSK0_9NEIS|nr:hypothetical protein [Crenobacter caeni]NDV13225.1 hypothetical protein [Crenobacter caeni]